MMTVMRGDGRDTGGGYVTITVVVRVRAVGDARAWRALRAGGHQWIGQAHPADGHAR